MSVLSLGRIIMELPPKTDNPRNSEGAFITLKNGDIMYFYTRYKGKNFSDDASADIAYIISKDNGETFLQGDVLFKCSDFDTEVKKCKNIMSVSLMRMKDEAIGIFFLIRYDYMDMCAYLFRSYDEGKSWSEGVKCSPAPGYFVTNNDRAVMLSNGRIVVPANFHRMRGNDTFNTVAESTFFLSDDDGKTFRESQEFCVLQDVFGGAGLQETGVIELEDNILWAFSRTTLGKQYSCYSYDKGETWTHPVPSWFSSPCSPMSMKRMPDNRLIAVWNPIPYYRGQKRNAWGMGRNPLALSLSKDNGKTWIEPYYIEDVFEDAGYCYTAIHFTNDGVLLAYCAGGKDDGVCLCKTRIRKIRFSELQ